MNESTSTGLKAHIEAAEERALGVDQHSALEAKEKVFHSYVPVPVEIGILLLVFAIGVLLFARRLSKIQN